MAEERFCIPICTKHNTFQTGRGRWLSITDDLENHIEFTESYEAILTEGECPKCKTDIEEVDPDNHAICLIEKHFGLNRQ